jgi:hypothetical protein
MAILAPKSQRQNVAGLLGRHPISRHPMDGPTTKYLHTPYDICHINMFVVK